MCASFHHAGEKCSTMSTTKTDVDAAATISDDSENPHAKCLHACKDMCHAHVPYYLMLSYSASYVVVPDYHDVSTRAGFY